MVRNHKLFITILHSDGTIVFKIGIMEKLTKPNFSCSKFSGKKP